MSNIQSLDYHDLLNFLIFYSMIQHYDVLTYFAFVTHIFIQWLYDRIHWNILITILSNVIDIHIYQNMIIRVESWELESLYLSALLHEIVIWPDNQ